MRPLFGVGALVSALVLAACSQGSVGQSREVPAKSGLRESPAAAASRPLLPTTVVNGVRLTDVRDVTSAVIGHQPVVLLFMAPGCESCRAEVRALAGSLGSHPDLRLVGVDMIGQENPRDLADYVNAVGIASSPFVWTVDTNATLTTKYQVVSLSSTVGIDNTGRVRFTNQGSVDGAQLLRQIAELSRS